MPALGRKRQRTKLRHSRQLQLDPLEDRRLLATIRLDDPQALAGDVADFEITADGQYGVYVADAVIDHQNELYSVEFATGETRKLTDVGVDGSVFDFEVSPDGQRVVYRSQSADGPMELYSVSIPSGAPVKLNGALVEGGNVDSREEYSTRAGTEPAFLISPDSSRVVYRADQQEDEFFELFSVSIDGGDVNKLNESRGNSIDPVFQISPDSNRVVYWAGRFTEELYSVPLSGGDPTLLIDGIDPGEFEISPDGSQVVYVATDALHRIPITGGESTMLGDLRIEHDVTDAFEISSDGIHVVYRNSVRGDRDELYSVPLNGGEPIKVAILTSDARLAGRGFEITADGTHVIYVNELSGSDMTALLRTPISGGRSIALSPFPSLTFRPYAQADFRISPDGSQVVYRLGQARDRADELYSAELAAGTFTRLDNHTSGEVAILSGFQISSDGQRVAYRAQSGEAVEIYSVPLSGGGQIKLNPDRARDGGVSGFHFTPDGGRVVYRAAQDSAGVSELYSVPASGGESTKLSIPIVAPGDAVSSFLADPSGEFIVYRADHEVDDVFELYSVHLDTRAVTKLNGPLVEFGDVETGFQISGDGARVVYLADQDTPGVLELYSAPLTGGGSIKLNAELGDDDRISDFKIAPDGSRLVYSVHQEEMNVASEELYSVSVGGGDITRLSEVVEYGTVLDFQIAPDSSRVVYIAEQDRMNLPELYSVPIAGGDFVKLNGVDSAGVQAAPGILTPTKEVRRKNVEDDDRVTVATYRPGSARDFRISPDSRHVVYLADQDLDFKYDLYSVPIDGGDFTKLFDAEVGFEKTRPFTISADSQHVVYLDGQSRDLQGDLWSVPTAGGQARKLNGDLRNVWSDFVLSPDSQWVAFRNDGLELFGVSIIGGTPVNLSNRPIVWANVEAGIDFTPDSQRVLYRIDQNIRDVFELRSAPITGGESIMLSDPSQFVAESYMIDRAGRTVLFRAEQEDSGVELYSVPLGGGDPWKLNDPLVAGGDVSNQLAVSPDGNHVIYLADQDFEHQQGIYQANLPLDLTVTSLTPDSTGFVVEFSTELNTEVLNLYDTQADGFGPADLVLEGATTGFVQGSFVVDPSLRGGRFIKSGALLAADTYTLRLRRGSEGFKSEQGVWLDGSQASFSFTNSLDGRVVSLDDFAQGPGQVVRLPGRADDGLPIVISDGTGVRSATIRIEYDPALLSISSATVGSTMPADSAVTLEASAPGALILSFTSPADLPAGEQVLVHLGATVPAAVGESYGGQHIVRLENVVLADAEARLLPAIGDHALHIAALYGDASGNGELDSTDASQIARVAAELDSGFSASPRVDPMITADLTGNGKINASDAVRLLQLLLVPAPLTVDATGVGPRKPKLSSRDALIPDERPEGEQLVRDAPTPASPAAEALGERHVHQQNTDRVLSELGDLAFDDDPADSLLADTVELSIA